MSIAKALAHATEVAFGEVTATWTPEWQWCVFDARPVRQGARMIERDLNFEAAVLKAYALSLEVPKR